MHPTPLAYDAAALEHRATIRRAELMAHLLRDGDGRPLHRTARADRSRRRDVVRTAAAHAGLS